jgi:hypothetical protein
MIVITMPAYRAEQTLAKTVADIPREIADLLILVIAREPAHPAGALRADRPHLHGRGSLDRALPRRLPHGRVGHARSGRGRWSLAGRPARHARASCAPRRASPRDRRRPSVRPEVDGHAGRRSRLGGMTRALRVAVAAEWADPATWYNALKCPAASTCEQ